MLGWRRLPAQAARIADLLGHAGLPSDPDAEANRIRHANQPSLASLGIPAEFMMISTMMNRQIDIPIGQMMLEAQKSAQVAQQQLAGDVQAIDAYNARSSTLNQQVRKSSRDAIGADSGADAPGGRNGWSTSPAMRIPLPDRMTKRRRSSSRSPGLSTSGRHRSSSINQSATRCVRRHACFGCRDSRADDGRPATESRTLRAGDQVLTQNPKTGELKYQPLVAVYHNPPNATFRIELDGESIVATGIHRLWKAGKGWTMVRELKPGDVLAHPRGIAVVKSVEKERVQPVFNLQVADGESFFVGRVGRAGARQQPINPTPEPFDAVPRSRASAAAVHAGQGALTAIGRVERFSIASLRGVNSMCFALVSGREPGSLSTTGPHPSIKARHRCLPDEAAGQGRQDADAQVRLALWCEAHGLRAERMKHLALAVFTTHPTRWHGA